MVGAADRFCRWADRAYRLPAASLAVFRVALAVFLLLPAGFPRWLGGLPTSLYDPPPGIVMFFSDFPPEWVMVGLSAVQTLGLAMVLFGVWTLPATLITVALIFVTSGFAFSIGKIDHGQMIPLAMLAMGMAGWGRAWSFDAWRRKQSGREMREAAGWPVAWLAFVMGLGYLTAAIPKAMTGWLHPELYATYDRLVRHAVAQERTRPLSQWLLEYPGWWWKLPDYGTVVAEAGLILLWPKRKWFLTGVLVMIGFHAGVFAMMEILFVANFVGFAALYDYRRWQRPLARLVPGRDRAWGWGMLAWPIGVALLVVLAGINMTADWQVIPVLPRGLRLWAGYVWCLAVTAIAFVWAWGAYLQGDRESRWVG